jgi:NADH:ubiquinone oxidoreductase subunit 5 (subunit L)/multisubunit Na+/H+ antiporter MnhA subunit
LRVIIVSNAFTSACLNVSNFAVCGILFLAGFYSKDLILEMVSLTKTPWPASASELYRSSDRRLSAKLVPTFADRG